MSDALDRQIARLDKYSKSGKAKLNTLSQYFSQRDNYRDPLRTCNSSTSAMYVRWLQDATNNQSPLADDELFIKVVFSIGDTIYHEVQTKACKYFGYATLWNTDEDIDFVNELLEAGFCVPVNILHRGTRMSPFGGHVIMLVGRKEGNYIVQDPFGKLSTGYEDTDGRLSLISEGNFVDRWQGGYRILANESPNLMANFSFETKEESAREYYEADTVQKTKTPWLLLSNSTRKKYYKFVENLE
jgi:hypothetical protein